PMRTPVRYPCAAERTSRRRLSPTNHVGSRSVCLCAALREHSRRSCRMSQMRQAAIAGIHEYPLRVATGVAAMQIKAASMRAALEDAGLKWSDVDGLYDAGDGEGGGGLG